MNKTELVKAVAAKTGYTQKDIATVLDSLQEITFETIKKEEVKLFSGLTVCTVEKAAKECRNPRTGEVIKVPAKTVPKVKIGKPMKDAVL